MGHPFAATQSILISDSQIDYSAAVLEIPKNFFSNFFSIPLSIRLLKFLNITDMKMFFQVELIPR